MAAAREAETGKQGSIPRPEPASRKGRSRAGEHPAPDQRPQRRFGKRNAKRQPDIYPSQQDARACGLFI